MTASLNLILAAVRRLLKSLLWNCGSWSSTHLSGNLVYVATQMVRKAYQTFELDSPSRNVAVLNLVLWSTMWRTDLLSNFMISMPSKRLKTHVRVALILETGSIHLKSSDIYLTSILCGQIGCVVLVSSPSWHISWWVPKVSLWSDEKMHVGLLELHLGVVYCRWLFRVYVPHFVHRVHSPIIINTTQSAIIKINEWTQFPENVQLEKKQYIDRNDTCTEGDNNIFRNWHR